MIDRENEGQRGAVAELQIRERVEVDPEDRRRGAIERLSRCHQEELVEGEQRSDHADERDEEDRLVGERERDLADPLPVARAIHHRGFGGLVRNRLDRGDVEKHSEAQHLPHDRDDHRPERAVGVFAEPDDRLGDDAEVDEQTVDQTEIVVEQPVPEQARHAETDHHRHENDGARELLERCIPRHEQRDQVPADHQDGRQVERVLQSETERSPELLVAVSLDVVRDADPPRWLDDRPIVERHPHHLSQRIGGEDEDEQDRRRQIEEPNQAIVRVAYMSGSVRRIERQSWCRAMHEYHGAFCKRAAVPGP